MIAKVLEAKNLYKAERQVVRNKGASGIDGMRYSKLSEYIQKNRSNILNSVRNNSYQPQAILGVPICKGKGKTGLLGIPKVVDRWLQQAVNQQLMALYEFEPFSYGFRPNRNIQKAVLQSQILINSGHQDIVNIDLKGFFDEVDHCILLQLVYKKVKCPTTLRLIRKWLRVPLLKNGKPHKRRKGIPQGSPLSPLLSSIMLDVLDKEMQSQGLKYVRYADDFSMYTKSKSEARRVGNRIYLFLQNKLKLPINRAKSGIVRPTNFELLGHSFTPIYKKGVKGQYQVIVSKSSWEKLTRKLKKATQKTSPLSLTDRLTKLNEICRGWMNSGRLANISTKIKKVDAWLRNRLRYCIWSRTCGRKSQRGNAKT